MESRVLQTVPGEERKIGEIRFKLLCVMIRQRTISARLQLAIETIELNQSKLEDYCTKRKLKATAVDKEQDRKALLSQIQKRDLQMQNKSRATWCLYDEITLETLLKINEYDLNPFKDLLKELDAIADTVQRNVTI
ncbi:uncharacterized protein DMAD_06840 [Drosophila madeirensis]|uniref:Uncharacterized protein n=1 Tax=Drosophila madeirensis TaxID=30013 RepID=A0AAU9FTH6_DROMD